MRAWELRFIALNLVNVTYIVMLSFHVLMLQFMVQFSAKYRIYMYLYYVLIKCVIYRQMRDILWNVMEHTVVPQEHRHYGIIN